MTFLPSDYESPAASSNYMKIQDGENKIRILSYPVLGWEDWEEKKPIRFRLNEKPAKSIDPKKPMKHFWSFVVWDYATSKVCILHLTQASIRNSIEALIKDKDWGDPFFFDIKIHREGEGMETKYRVNPLPHKQIAHEVKEAFYATPVTLDALFTGEDPFDRNSTDKTQGVFTEDDLKIADKKTLSKEQVSEIINAIGDDAALKDDVKVMLKRAVGTDDIYKVPVVLFDKIIEMIEKKKHNSIPF